MVGEEVVVVVGDAAIVYWNVVVWTASSQRVDYSLQNACGFVA